MSKTTLTIYYFAFVGALILQNFGSARAQTVETRIKITETSAFIEGNFKDAPNAKNVTNFSFLKSYAGLDNLGARISDVALRDAGGATVDYKKLADGEYLAARSFTGWSYKVNLDLSKNPSARAHVSWLAGEQGI